MNPAPPLTPARGSTSSVARSHEDFIAAKKRMGPLAVVLSLGLIPVILVPELTHLSATTDTWLDVATRVIWAAFAVEYLVLFYLAPDRRQMMKDHPLQLILITVPILRPLEGFLALRLLRAFASFGLLITAMRAATKRKTVRSYLMVLMVVLVGGAALTWMAERNRGGATINSFGDAMWWAIVTATTVGYGDYSPTTTAGRIIGVALMILGIGLLSLVTANVAAYFVDQDNDEDVDALRSELAAVHEKLDLLLTMATPVVADEETTNHAEEETLDTSVALPATVGPTKGRRRVRRVDQRTPTF